MTNKFGTRNHKQKYYWVYPIISGLLFISSYFILLSFPKDMIIGQRVLLSLFSLGRYFTNATSHCAFLSWRLSFDISAIGLIPQILSHIIMWIAKYFNKRVKLIKVFFWMDIILLVLQVLSIIFCVVIQTAAGYMVFHVI